MLLTKRRSRSESRKIEETKSNPKKDIQSPVEILENEFSRRSQTLEKRSNLERMETVPGMGRRKTSAELISEAKTFLGSMNISNGNLASNPTASVGGVRLLNTRRPITPREPGRALYGKVALAGRPPSAFSLKYLRNEVPRTPKTPSLAPIKSQSSLDCDPMTFERFESQFQSKRSNSFDVPEPGILSNEMGGSKRESGSNTPGQIKSIPKKLPSLEVKGIAIRDMFTKKFPLRNDLETQAFGADQNDSNKAISILSSSNFFNANCNILTQSTTEKLIELLKEHAGLKDCSEDTVRHITSILTEIYGRVRQNEKKFKRGFILGGLYGLVECTSPKILLAVARVILALRVTGSNLTGACKLIFKVARNEQHDSLFYDNDILELLIDGLGRASPLDDPEACIYGYGSIRFLTSSNEQDRSKDMQQMTKDVNRNCIDILRLPQKPATAPPGGSKNLQPERFKKLSKQCTLVERLAQHGAVELMILHLQILNESGAIKKLNGPPLHSLYQLSAALRALADVRQISCSLEKDLFTGEALYLGHKVLSSSVQLELACPHLIRAAEISIGELEVQCNIIRTLSILSEDENCCKAMASSTARIGILVGPSLELLNTASQKLLALFSRLGYILGNIMAKHDESRVQFYHNDVAMEYFLKAIQLYSMEPLTLQNAMGDTVIDVLVKMIRVIANMSVNSEVGFGLGNTQALGGLLLQLLTTNQKIDDLQQQNGFQELTLATLGALHNLCFYQDKNFTPAQVIASAGSLQSTLLDVTEAVYKTLHRGNDPMVIVEATRVLGNITRNDKARNYFCKSGGLQLVVQFIRRRNEDIDFLDYDFKACAAGVLVNLLGDASNRTPFLQLNGFTLLYDLLRLALVKNHDWFLATIACQAFWNLFIDAPHMTDVCDESFLDEICDLLSDYLDENLFDEEPDLQWEDFAMVATDLLERIQNNFEKETQEQHLKQLMRSSDDQENNDEDDVYIEGI